MDKKLFDIPVLLIAFNRPETTCHVFDQIRKLKPAQLFIFSDAARENVPDEQELVDTCRCLFEDSQINWECKVERWYPDTNMGCAVGVSSAITWAFETCEKLVILEDDCLPHPSFFNFCKFMLDKYSTNDRVMHVSGSLRNENQKETVSDHFFSLIGNIDGWATWRRAWNKYDFWMEQLPEMKIEKRFQRLLGNADISKYWFERFDKVYKEEKKQSWEVQWQYTLFKNYGIAAVPNVNLISNIDIGFANARGEIKNGSFLETKAWKNLQTEHELAADDKLVEQHSQMLFFNRNSLRAGIITKLITLLRLNY